MEYDGVTSANAPIDSFNDSKQLAGNRMKWTDGFELNQVDGIVSTIPATRALTLEQMETVEPFPLCSEIDD